MRPLHLLVFAASLWLAGCFSPTAGASPRNIYVSPDGRDSWTGALSAENKTRTDGPLASLEGARDRIRAMSARPAGGITVWLAGGDYFEASPFTLSAQDSGSADCPIIYRALPGARVRLTGSRAVDSWSGVIDPSVLRRLPQAALSHVVVADLRRQGITDYGALTRRGFGLPQSAAGLELFFDHAPMLPAQWPQTGWAHVSAVKAGASGTDLTYTGDEPAKWAGESDLWLYGYWAYDWADEYVPVSSIDSSARALHVPAPAIVMSATPGARFRALNMLEELSKPGEYALDRAAGRLYFWPPKPIRPGEAEVSLGSSLLDLSGVADVSFVGLILEGCRGTAAALRNCSGCRVAGCVVRDTGNLAVAVNGGARNGIEGCDISDTGDGGVSLGGGDRATLAAGGNFVDDCDIGRFSRWDRTYTPAVAISGVGNRITRCRLHDAPHAAIILNGNDHLIAGNEIARVCEDSGDAGAFYMGRDWTMRGNVVKNNYFHQIGGSVADLRGDANVNAIYLDDVASGATIVGNICQDAPTGLQLGGGRDDKIEGNVFIDCRTALMVDARGLEWSGKLAADSDWQMPQKLAAVHFDQPPYSARYPALAGILEDDPGAPKGDVIAGNVISGGGPKWMQMDAAAAPFVVVSGNVTQAAAQVQPGRALRYWPASLSGNPALPNIAVARIGLYENCWRAVLPDAPKP